MTLSAHAQQEIPKAYNHQDVEGKWYRFWEESGYFRPVPPNGKEPFVVILPPPNVTGELHLGHALTAAIEDALVRWHRMRGEPTLWLPGEDHAGIAAQVVVEQQIARDERGLTRHLLGRDLFLRRMWQWMGTYRSIIAEQHKRLGASLDWSRERFTLDDVPVRAVRTTFVRLYHRGLIYRGERMINWCPRCATVLSDLEVDHQELDSNLWYVRYPLEGETGRFVTVATTRPETILGDTAVAVHPDDARYRDLVGRRVVLPFVERPIPIIADEAIDPAFGTGALKVTPAHDPVDFEIAQRHKLPAIDTMNLDATMNAEAGPYEGMDRFACRDAIVRDLEEAGLLDHIEPYRHAVGHCDRCDTIVEPRVGLQWWVRTGPLAEPALRVVREGDIRIVPEHFARTYEHWMENIRDWCISRQLWWGHRIPVWYCADCGRETVPPLDDPMRDPESCAHCGSEHLEQDPDVLDTWFSSGLWPHSTLGWPDDTEDFRRFYPTSVMETGYDILFFWVARMIMMGLANTGRAPFHTVYLHGLIRDEKGDKMSKSRGNVISPDELIQRYGADALRFALLTGNTPGNDLRVSHGRVEAARNFANKLWNAARYVLGQMHGRVDPAEAYIPTRPLEDRWILSRLDRATETVNRMLADFQLGEAQRHLYDFVWSEFCDWYIELSKVPREPGVASPLPVLVAVLDQVLRLLHPFMPFLTEELWQALRERAGLEGDALIVAPYPEPQPSRRDPEAEAALDLVTDLIRGLRNIRGEFRIAPNQALTVQVAADGAAREAIEALRPAILALARAEGLAFLPPGSAKPAGAISVILPTAEAYVPLAGLVDLGAEGRRIERELAQARADNERLEAKLSDHQFLTRAPAPVVEKERDRLVEQRERVARLEARLREIA